MAEFKARLLCVLTQLLLKLSRDRNNTKTYPSAKYFVRCWNLKHSIYNHKAKQVREASFKPIHSCYWEKLWHFKPINCEYWKTLWKPCMLSVMQEHKPCNALTICIQCSTVEILNGLRLFPVIVGWLCWGLTSQSTIFQSCRDGAIASWVINQYFRGVKCLAQGHNTAAVGLEPRTSRSGVRHSTTEPPRSPFLLL